MNLVNKTTKANSITTGIFGWYSIRLDMLITLVLISGCSACVLLRGTAEPILLSLMLQYLLTLQMYMKYCMNNFGEIERKMVAVQRLYDLELIPQEKSNQPKVKDDNWPAKGKVDFINV